MFKDGHLKSPLKSPVTALIVCFVDVKDSESEPAFSSCPFPCPASEQQTLTATSAGAPAS